MNDRKTGPTTNARGQARRRQVLDAALETFGARGFHGASLAAIADKVGISEPGLLHHFKSKEQLLFAVLEDHESVGVRRTEVALAEGGSLAGALKALAARHERDPAFVRLLVMLAAECTDVDHPAHAWFVARYRRSRNEFAGWAAAEQRVGRLTGDLEPEVLGALLVAILDGLELQYLLDPDATSIVGPLMALTSHLEPAGSDTQGSSGRSPDTGASR